MKPFNTSAILLIITLCVASCSNLDKKQPPIQPKTETATAPDTATEKPVEKKQAEVAPVPKSTSDDPFIFLATHLDEKVSLKPGNIIKGMTMEGFPESINRVMCSDEKVQNLTFLSKENFEYQYSLQSSTTISNENCIATSDRFFEMRSKTTFTASEIKQAKLIINAIRKNSKDNTSKNLPYYAYRKPSGDPGFFFFESGEECFNVFLFEMENKTFVEKFQDFNCYH